MTIAGRFMVVFAMAWASSVHADVPLAGTLGPYNLTLLQGGVGMTRTLAADTLVLASGAVWSMSGWVKVDVASPGEVTLAGLGDPDSGSCDCLFLDAGRLGLKLAGGRMR